MVNCLYSLNREEREKTHTLYSWNKKWAHTEGKHMVTRVPAFQRLYDIFRDAGVVTTSGRHREIIPLREDYCTEMEWLVSGWEDGGWKSVFFFSWQLHPRGKDNKLKHGGKMVKKHIRAWSLLANSPLMLSLPLQGGLVDRSLSQAWLADGRTLARWKFFTELTTNQTEEPDWRQSWSHCHSWGVGAHKSISQLWWCAVWPTILFVARLPGVKLLRKKEDYRYLNLQMQNTAKPQTHTHTSILKPKSVPICFTWWFTLLTWSSFAQRCPA